MKTLALNLEKYGKPENIMRESELWEKCA